MKYLYTLFVISIFLFSCKKGEINSTVTNPGSTSGSIEPCNLDCPQWQECSRRLINPNNWLGPSEWYCKNIFIKYYQTGIFEATQNITDDNGVAITEHTHINVGYPSGNKLNLSIGANVSESYDIQISFINEEDFNIPYDLLYLPELEDYVFCQGSGDFERNGNSASFTIEINLNYTYNNMNYHLHIIGSNEYGQSHP